MHGKKKGPSPGNQKKGWLRQDQHWAHGWADLDLSEDTTPLQFPVPRLISNSGHHRMTRSVIWRKKKCKPCSTPQPRIIINSKDKCNDVYQFALQCCWQPQTERQKLHLGIRWVLELVHSLDYAPGKQILSCFPVVYTGGWKQPERPGFCPQLSQATSIAFVLHSVAWQPYCDQAQCSLQHRL